ncbi:MAG: phenylalanine--tRNA ligase subunit beta [Flavobacteriales bacterium]
MRISYQWLRQYLKSEHSPEQLADLLTSIGLEVESLEQVEAVPGGLKGVVVGEVLTCVQHPDADRLRLTTVHVGQEQPLQIVCGAPNVAAGQKVLVATIGTKLFPKDGDPLTIKKGKIRGQESHGMICAEDELGIGTSHDGILILEASAVVGTAAADHLQLHGDVCFEIGLTPNRTDAISHLGVARDLYAAIRNHHGVLQREVSFEKPTPVALSPSVSPVVFDVQVDDVNAVPRYAGIVLSDIQVGPSPAWLQDRLVSIGLRPIDVIVDITNFVQHEMGQPLHAFDFDQMQGGKIHVRMAHVDEFITTLDGVERKLDAQDIVISDAHRAQCIAGVLGGQSSGVSASTKTIFLESAYFNPTHVRKTARRHGIHSDASFRFERGCDPSSVPVALWRAVQLMVELGVAKVASEMQDVYPQPTPYAHVDLQWNAMDRLIGQNLDRTMVRSVLQDLEICITSESAEAISMEIPHYRVDVRRAADVIEEILRIYGYDAIHPPQQMTASLSAQPARNAERMQRKVAEALSAQGLFEMMGMSLVKEIYAPFVTQQEELVSLLNPLSSDLSLMRPSLLFGMLEAVALNLNHRQLNVAAYEFGKRYQKGTNGYAEAMELALVFSGHRTGESWSRTQEPVRFTDVRSAVDSVCRILGLSGIALKPISHPLLSEGVQVLVGKKEVGVFGQVDAKLLSAVNIKQEVWTALLDWDALIKLSKRASVTFTQLDKFPSVRRDLSMLLDHSVSYQALHDVAFEAERKMLREVNLFDVYEGKNLEAGKKSYAMSFILQDSTRTMTDAQVDQCMQRIQNALESKLGAQLRG